MLEPADTSMIQALHTRGATHMRQAIHEIRAPQREIKTTNQPGQTAIYTPRIIWQSPSHNILKQRENDTG